VDGARPRISRARILAGGRIEFRLSEAATVKVVIRGSGKTRTLTRKATSGRNRMRVKLARGSRITITATDAAGNRSRRVLRAGQSA
jgi:hypothetical protein